MGTLIWWAVGVFTEAILTLQQYLHGIDHEPEEYILLGVNQRIPKMQNLKMQ
jgi:hypothetical protein